MFLRSLKIRITSLFTVLVLLGTALLFGFSYFSLRTLLFQNDQDEIRSLLLRYWGEYHTSGIRGDDMEYAFSRNLYFIRIARIDGATLFAGGTLLLAGLSIWEDFDIEDTDIASKGGFRYVSAPDYGYRIEYASVSLRDGNILQVGITTAARDSALSTYRTIFSLLAAPFIAVVFFGGWVISARIFRPVNQLIESVRTIIDTGRMDRRITERGRGDELDELVVLYNRMLEKIELLITGMRGALDSVAHELRTPLTRFRNRAENALHDDDSETYRDALESGIEESETILTMLRALMDISEAETGIMRLDRTVSNLEDILGSAVDLYSYVAEEKGIGIEFPGGGSIRVNVDPSRMRQVFANLLDNAVKYTQRGGRVTVSYGSDESASPPAASITVTDTGNGIPTDELPFIWDRLARGSASRNLPGLGLGLSLVKAVVEAHGGTVNAESTEGEGARFTVMIPSDPPARGD